MSDNKFIAIASVLLFFVFLFIVLSLIAIKDVEAKFVYWSEGETEVQYAQTGEPVPFKENLIVRSPSAELFDNLNGTQTVNLYGLPHFYLLDGVWKYVDWATTTPENWRDNLKPRPQTGFIYSAFADELNFSPSGGVDGICAETTEPQTWAVKIAETDADSCDTSGLNIQLPKIQDVGSSGNFHVLNRAYLIFDKSTSTLEGVTYVSSSIGLFLESRTRNLSLDPDFVFVEVSTVATTSLVVGDYDIQNFVTSTEFTNRQAFLLATGQYHHIPLNSAGLAYVADNDFPSFGMINGGFDLDELDPVAPDLNNQDRLIWTSSEGANAPILSITFNPAVEAGTATSTIEQTQQNFAWGVLIFMITFWFFFKGWWQ